MAPFPPYILPRPSCNLWLFLWPERYEDQVIPNKQLLLKTNQVLTTPQKSFSFLYHHLLFLPASLLPALPPGPPGGHSKRPTIPAPHSPPTTPKPGMASGNPQAFLLVEVACTPLSQGLSADQGHMFAYLLAEEEALGGENSEAISGRAFGRAVGTGCLADFSLLLLTQIEESVCGLHRQRWQKCGLF